MILGTLIFLSKSGPAALPIITKILQKYKKMWKHPLNILFFISENLKLRKFDFRKAYPPFLNGFSKHILNTFLYIYIYIYMYPVLISNCLYFGECAVLSAESVSAKLLGEWSLQGIGKSWQACANNPSLPANNMVTCVSPLSDNWWVRRWHFVSAASECASECGRTVRNEYWETSISKSI